MAIIPPFRPLIDRGALHALLLQDALVEALDELGDYRWDVDMLSRELAFTSEQDPSRAIRFRIGLIASIAPGPRSLLWGWAHPQGDPEGSSAQLREAGRGNEILELVSEELQFPDGFDEQDRDAMAALAHEVGTVAVAALGRGPYYSALLSGGTRMVFIFEEGGLEVTLRETLIKLPRLLAGGSLRDPRTSIWGLSTARGWRLEWQPDFAGASLGDGTTDATIEFDEHGRITKVSGAL